jgi:hypothetical protein
LASNPLVQVNEDVTQHFKMANFCTSTGSSGGRGVSELVYKFYVIYALYTRHKKYINEIRN